MPEKLTYSILDAGLKTILADLDTYLPDIFDLDVLGQDYLDTVKKYLEEHTIKITQGYPMEDERVPGWFVIPSGTSPHQQAVEDYVEQDDIEDTDEEITENFGVFNTHNIKVISASINLEVTLFLDVVARYILYQSKASFRNGEPLFDSYGFQEVTITTTDMDPVYQFLPQHHAKRTITVSGKTMDTWSVVLPLVQHIEFSFGTFFNHF